MACCLKSRFLDLRLTRSHCATQADGVEEAEELAFQPPPPAKPRRPLGSVGDDDFGYQVDEEGVR